MHIVHTNVKIEIAFIEEFIIVNKLRMQLMIIIIINLSAVSASLTVSVQ